MKTNFNYPHLYLDTDQKIHLLMPIASGDQISTNSTCQATKDIKEFFSQGTDLMHKGS
jgi:hypothetical protein